MNTTPSQNAPRLLRLLETTTEAHRQNRTQSRGRLEALLFDLRFPSLLLGPVEGDLLAGRIDRPLAGLSNQAYPEQRCADTVGFFLDFHRAERLDREQSLRILGDEKLADIRAYWEPLESQPMIQRRMDEPMRMALHSHQYDRDSSVAHQLFRIASHSSGYEDLLTHGVSGLRDQLQQRMTSSPDAETLDFLASAVSILNTFSRILADYTSEFSRMAAEAEPGPRRHAFNRIAVALEALTHRAPEHFFEAVQLLHLFTVSSYNCNALGRLDDSLGSYLTRDLERGVITPGEATDLILSHWQLLGDHFDNSRITLGGRGRRDPDPADAYVRLALEATRRYYATPEARLEHRITGTFVLCPQVALRLHHDTPEDIRQQVLDVLAQAGTFPLLYNDDVNIPAVARAFDLSEEEAAQYTFFDCGEYLIHNQSIGTPSAIVNLPKALEIALHDGMDPKTGRRLGPPNPGGTRFECFEQVWAAYCFQIEFAVHQCARFQQLVFDVLREQASLVAMGMTMPACLEKGRGLLDACPMLGGTLETYGNITTADSLYAIREWVYRRHAMEMTDLIRALDEGFDAHPDLREKLLALPKFGNDHDEVDAMAEQVNQHICAYTRARANDVGLHHYLVVVINNGANVTVGHHVGATPDGRAAGMPVSNGHTPTPGRDTHGITALMRSILKLSCDQHAGAVHNIRFSKETFQRHPEQVRSLIDTYFASGGTQCMITVTSRAELEEALAHPEAYPHLMVRVGGFSARFIDLPSDIQQEILARNAY